MKGILGIVKFGGSQLETLGKMIWGLFKNTYIQDHLILPGDSGVDPG